MKISYQWLQTFFDQKLPEPRVIAEALTMHAFEVEGVTEREGDTIFDIDVLPNRAHDCLSHYGIAREIATLFDLPLQKDLLRSAVPEWATTERLQVVITDETLCPRYSALLIEGVKVGPSPDWLAARLASLGQRSINNIVDATNYVMFSMGQPLHAFDFKKLTLTAGAASIAVRSARAGEKIVTLDDVEHELKAGMLLIVDGGSDTPIAIAGIKGGKMSAIDRATEHIVLEAANFHPTHTRKTAQALGLRTDASTHFEHAIAAGLTLHALREAAALIADIAGGNTVVDGLAEAYPKPEAKRVVEVSLAETNQVLGTSWGMPDLEKLLTRLNFEFTARAEQSVTVTAPFERLDIAIPEDVIEEVGRVAGYEHIDPIALPPEDAPTINKRAYASANTRHFLAERGFSEVYTYAFAEKGETELANPIASDKGYLRPDLATGLGSALEQNARNADLLGLDTIRIFEIGTVFPVSGEHTVLGIGIRYDDAKKQKDSDAELVALLEELGESLRVGSMESVPTGGIVEVDFDALAEKLNPKVYAWPEASPETPRYQRISPYPFVLRDIAVWVAASAELAPKPEDVLAVIQEKAGDLLVRTRLFDEYEKDGRVSYAFRLVFQSPEKTLTDDEVGLIMWQVTATLNAREGWEVR